MAVFFFEPGFPSAPLGVRDWDFDRLSHRMDQDLGMNQDCPRLRSGYWIGTSTGSATGWTKIWERTRIALDDYRAKSRCRSGYWIGTSTGSATGWTKIWE